VVVAAVVMGLAGTYQFAWSSIRLPLGARLGASEAALGTVFTLFTVFQTVSQFPAAWVRDRYGPRPPTAAGAVLLAAGYAGTALAPAVEYVYLCYGLGGIGAGTVYTVAINTPVKWFDDRRGLATGVVGFAYAGLSFALIPAIRPRIDDAFGRTLLGLALVVGLVTLVAVPVLRDPDPDRDPSPDRDPAADGGGAGSEAEAEVESGGGGGGGGTPGPVAYTWRETIRTWQFWLLYAVFVVVNGVGLMVIAKIVGFAETMGLAAAATGAASLVALGDGSGVVVGGGLSDRFGRERTLAASLVVGGGCLGGATVAGVGGAGLAFLGLIGAAAFFRSPAFSIGPSLVGDYYGTAHSSENYALLYSAKLPGGVVGGVVTSLLIVRFGWDVTFLLGAGLLVAAGVGTAFLRPVRPGPTGGRAQSRR